MLTIKKLAETQTTYEEFQTELAVDLDGEIQTFLFMSDEELIKKDGPFE